jgi:uncharacterized protein
MIFEWDDAKNQSNLRNHGFDFADAEKLFRGLLVVESDTRNDYDENRWSGLGVVGGCLAQIVFTEPAPGTIRIISLRKATSRERKEYEKAIQDRLEAH